MSPTRVLVISTSPDLKAEVIAESIAARRDMVLVKDGCVSPAGAEAVLEHMPPAAQCAVVLVGRPAETTELGERYLARPGALAVMVVDVDDDVVRIAVRDPGLDALLAVLCGLVARATVGGEERLARVQLRAVAGTEPPLSTSDLPKRRRPLLDASVAWVHTVLRDAVGRVPDGNGDVHGLSVTKKTLLQALDGPPAGQLAGDPRAASDADATLDAQLAVADPRTEPLAAAVRRLALRPLEFRMVLLGLAPEMDLRFQRCVGFLLDDIGRRAGTVGLFASLLGSQADVRDRLERSGSLGRWLIFEADHAREIGSDEPLRIDSFLGRWLLGDADALARDPRVRRALRVVPWPGSGLLQRDEDSDRGADLVRRLQSAGGRSWLLLDGPDPAGWRALIELGATACGVTPIRVDPSRLASADLVEVEDCARRLARVAALTDDPLVLDVAHRDALGTDDYWLRLFLATVSRAGRTAALVSSDEARSVRLLGSTPFEVLRGPAVPLRARTAALRAAAIGAGAYVTTETAEALAGRYPLAVDDLEHAMRLAQSRPLDGHVEDGALARFTGACREVSTEGVSDLADRVEPLFDLDDIVLPPDRKEQLVEIVDNVRLAPRVLDEWRFGEHLVYGRGVTALFFGPSGVGKSLASICIARRLGIPLLRLDLSKVVSKYIGDTEKNVDRVFTDAERSGSVILIDEADALLGRRSEVKDAHDRYANIEVAFLLQRMEAFEGLAILTTNMRQSLDPAFVRRLRFMVEFPRPDADAREQIWRLCLPEGSHALDDEAVRQLARRIDLTGGHIRQITLRAAFMAAAADSLITLEHVARAARAELAKLGMPPVDLDLGGARRAA